jgi:hypothetical protein
VGTVDTWEGIEGAVEHPYTFDPNVISLIGTPDGEGPIAPGPDGAAEVRGVAWADDDDAVGSVEVSADGGRTRAEAELFGPDHAGAWRLFRYEWDGPRDPPPAVPGDRRTWTATVRADLGGRGPAGRARPRRVPLERRRLRGERLATERGRGGRRGGRRRPIRVVGRSGVGVLGAFWCRRTR